MDDQLSSDLASLKINRDERPGSSSVRRAVIAVVGFGLLVGAGVVGYQKLAPRVFKQQVSLTEVSTISPAQSLVLVTSTGYVVPQSWSKVGAKIPGRLAQVLVKEGDTVKAGDVIATLDDADQKSAIAAAQSRVSVARARAATARANRAEIRVQVDRTRALVDNGALGRAQLEDLEAREKALEEAVKAADAEALAVQAEVESLRILLRDRVVVAPINGTVIAKPAAAGETVGPQLTGIANVAEIADFGSIVVETDVPEARLDLIKLDGPAEIVLDAYPNRRYRGVTGDIGRRVNRAKATVVVKVKFKDTLDDVLPDMQARVSFLSAELAAESLVEAPKKVVAASAIVERDGRKAVWTVESGRLHLVYVSVGAPVGTSVELAEGPVAGTRVVSAPARDLFEGQRIKEPEAQ
ncbi:MAG: efflux RND transporter periplasmic adaptor subunit [Polyangiaceae bacterium]|nr:efflux RND transporter periplasmic adaptor subunit [Polyangiaceae bacterium]